MDVIIHDHESTPPSSNKTKQSHHSNNANDEKHPVNNEGNVDPKKGKCKVGPKNKSPPYHFPSILPPLPFSSQI
jgi:hypothetical protein